MANYNTTLTLPYTRVTDLSIRDYGNNNISIEYSEIEALRDANGIVHNLTEKVNKRVLDLTKITEPVQAVNPATGEDIPNLSFTRDQVFLGILAFIRQDQKRRDAEANG